MAESDTQKPQPFTIGHGDFGLVMHDNATLTLLTAEPGAPLSPKQKALVAAALRIENDLVFIQELSAWYGFYKQVPEGEG